jgi:hypothetical protein
VASKKPIVSMLLLAVVAKEVASYRYI